VDVVQEGLAIPWDVAFAPDGRMFVTERDTDRILIYASGAPRAPVIASTTLPDMSGFQAGPMGLVLHPRFEQTPSLYVCVTRNVRGAPRLRVLRFRVTGAGTGTRLGSETTIVQGAIGSIVNSGCRLRFGPDGHLWITVGHGQDEDTSGDPDSPMGKVLRVEADGAIPPDNPLLPGATERTAAFSMGHRNPQGIDFAPGRSDPYVIEHGPDHDDEINRIEPATDYGWPETSGPDGPGGAADPAWASGASTLAPSGGMFAVGREWGAWEGDLFVANLAEADLRRFRLSADGLTLTQKDVLFDGRFGRLRTVSLGPGGALYLTTSNSTWGEAIDRIIRVRPRLTDG
jgi:glucose/arabinose dehydrogenase